MSIPIASEKSLLTHEEFEAVKATHHPAVSGMSVEALQSAQRDLRQRREKTRTLVRQNRRQAQAKRGAREASPGAEEPRASRRKQVFAQALKRINHELERRRVAAARATLADAVHRALKKRRMKAVPERPASSHTLAEGAVQKPGRRRKVEVEGREVGRVSKATKVAKAKRDP
jgi:hypothetical protein